VVAAMRQLSPDQREVLLLRMAAGLTAPEVAAVLGKTTGAVKAIQHCGLQRLAQLLELRSPTAAMPLPGSLARGVQHPEGADGMPGGEQGRATRPD
jgi:hypothetical protein